MRRRNSCCLPCLTIIVRTLEQAAHLLDREMGAHSRLRWLGGLLVAILAVAGCAGRRPAAASIPAPPAPPSSTAAGSAAAPAAGPSSTAGLASPPTRGTPFVPGVYLEQGVASWYGVPFNGRRAANGEIFDMNMMVAAHRTLPFGSIVRVTNLNNGLQAEVRIIDRGPFVGGRVLDLAYGLRRAPSI